MTIKMADGTYSYLVNGRPQTLIGVGYNPIYRNLTPDQRTAAYRRDFQILCRAGANTITGWDADKGYEQDKFDELTLAVANQYGLGVIMPLNLDPNGNYDDPAFVGALQLQARQKIERFKNYPALRMWGVGNEVFAVMSPDKYPSFERAYLSIIDLFHQLDPAHPVIYREAEDTYVPELVGMLRESSDMRPWLQYGANIYTKDPTTIIDDWPTYGLDRPLFVSEYGWDGHNPIGKAQGYANMWRTIRDHPQYVLGGAAYAWTTEGPEPTDKIWGLMDGNSRPVDNAFNLLASLWRTDPGANTSGCRG